MLRHLRLAVSLLTLAICLLVVAAWHRSHRLQEAVYCVVSPTQAFAVVSDRGRLRSYTFDAKRLARVPRYGTVSRCHLCCHDGAECPVLCDDPSRGWEVAMPHWVAVFAAATIAAAPWFRPRFSLRAMLIAMTLIAALLGFVAYSLQYEPPPF